MNTNSNHNNFFVIQYNDKYGTGMDKKIEVLIKHEKDFNNWLKKHNQERKQSGEMEESKDEFDIIPIELFK